MRLSSKRLTGLVVVAAVALLASSACTGGSSGSNGKPAKGNTGYADCAKNPNTCNGGETKAGGAYVFALERSFPSWNVNTASGDVPSAHQAMAGLLPQVFRAQPDGTLKLNADLMVSAELTNQNPQTVVYKIKPTAVWNDGQPIGADDFLLAWKQNSGNTTYCTKCDPTDTAGYALVKSIVGSDNGKTATVTFADGKVYTDWKRMFSVDGLYPAHTATKQGFDLAKADGVQQAADWFASTTPAWSGGPYVVDSYDKDKSLTLKKNDKWYGAVQPNLERLTFRFGVSDADLGTGLKDGSVTGLNVQPDAELMTQLGVANNVISYLGHGYEWQHVDLNLANRFLADPPVRQAMFTSIDAKGIVAATYGKFDKAAKPLGNHNFFPGDPRYKDVVTSTGQGTGDLDKAKNTLAKAGYSITSGRLYARSGEAFPRLRLRYAKSDDFGQLIAERVQNALRGIGVEVDVLATDDLEPALKTGDYDLALRTTTGSPFFSTTAVQSWGTGGVLNYGKYSNAEVDKLINGASLEFNVDKAADMVVQADELMSKDAYVLPLVQVPTVTATENSWVNIRDNPTQWTPTYNLQEWGRRKTASASTG
jgi:peptide/nickel transport system substrate-binding protein